VWELLAVEKMELVFKWLIRAFSLIAIGNTIRLTVGWGVEFYREGQFIHLPVAALPPILMIWFFLFVKIRPPNHVTWPLFDGLRSEMIKCAVLTFGFMFLAHNG
jgi:hypothetical protein